MGPHHHPRDLAPWQHAGEVSAAPTAADALRYSLDVLTDDFAFIACTTPSFLLIPTLHAIAGLLDASDDVVHRDLASLLGSLCR